MAAVDLSDTFWQFVTDVMALPYTKLLHTSSFAQLSDAPGSVVLRFSVLGLTEETASKCSELDGVTRDDEHGCFTFCDVTSLMHNTPRLVCCHEQRQLLLKCLGKILNYVEVTDLANDLEQTNIVCDVSDCTNLRGI